MDNQRFDALVKTLITSGPRRGVLQALAGGALAALLGRFSAVEDAEGKKKRNSRKKRPPLQFNAFECVEVGKSCRSNSANCCSGICQGKRPRKGEKDTSRCVAHDTGGCQPGQEGQPCRPGGTCAETTGKAGFCAFGIAFADCQKDADCDALFGPGAACIVTADPNSSTGTSTFCAVPDPDA